MSREPKRIDSASYFTQSDPSVHMLGLPKARPRLGKWGVVAVLIGALLAIGVILLVDYSSSF
ncbi:MAG TPA: hypothetical protein VMH05_01185 [Bryobacteraceae bacterium]|nr:hypothetical protein [Bryobacteraceae bacterium]